ncbi:MAG: hypothetical protein L0Z50_33630 [Verrucomicrobiales bacterium]|nr:hypothetical protein [Verrucomicrobiales bacterium]
MIDPNNPAGVGPGAAMAAPGKAGPGVVDPPVDPGQVVPEGTDPAALEALKAVEAATRKIGELQAAIGLAGAALSGAIGVEERAAYLIELGAADVVVDYQAARMERIARAEALERLQAGLRGARTALHEAKTAHFEVNRKTVLSRFQRLTVARAKAARNLQASADAYGKNLAQFERDNAKLADLFSVSKNQVFTFHLLEESFRQVLPFRVQRDMDNFLAEKRIGLVFGSNENFAGMVERSNADILRCVSTPPATEDDDA